MCSPAMALSLLPPGLITRTCCICFRFMSIVWHAKVTHTSKRNVNVINMKKDKLGNVLPFSVVRKHLIGSPRLLFYKRVVKINV